MQTQFFCLMTMLTLSFFGRLHSQTTEPEIQVLSFPPPARFGPVTGKVTGVDPTKYMVVPIINVFDTLWSKPTYAHPYLSLDENGFFTGDLATGGQDECAQYIYLFLLPTNSLPTLLTIGGGTSVPPQILTQAVAFVSIDRRLESKEITWSGRTWKVKNTDHCSWGPDNNVFGNDNVRVDENGDLVLEIRFIDGMWKSAEVILQESLGYGSYRFIVDTDLSDFPDPIVLGLFTYDPSAFQESYREIDIEFGKALVGKPETWQFVLQPYDDSQHRFRFVPPAFSNGWTHTFTWLPQLLVFDGYAGKANFGTNITASYFLENSEYVNLFWSIPNSLDKYVVSSTNLPQEFTSSGFSYWYNFRATNELGQEHFVYVPQNKFLRVNLSDITVESDLAPFQHRITVSSVPKPGSEQTRINLWLFNRTSPSLDTNMVYQVRLSKFEFDPLPELSKFKPRLNLPVILGGDISDVFRYNVSVTFPKE